MYAYGIGIYCSIMEKSVIDIQMLLRLQWIDEICIYTKGRAGYTVEYK